MDLTVLPGFMAVVAILVVVPGPDMMLVMSAGATGGSRAVLATAVGATAGVAVYLGAVATGLSAILLAEGQQVSLTISALQFVSGLYLMWLGLKTWHEQRVATQGMRCRHSTTTFGWLRRGLTVNLANPKAMVFFAAVLPAFVGSATHPRAQLLTLGGVLLTVGFTVNVSMGCLIGTTSKHSWTDRGGSVLGRAGGVALIAIGIATVGTALH